MLVAFFELLFELFHFRTNDRLAIGLVGMGTEIVLMVIIRSPEFLKRDNLGDDRAGLVRLAREERTAIQFPKRDCTRRQSLSSFSDRD